MYDLLNDPAVSDLLTDEQRNELSWAVVQELDAIAATQKDSRDETGQLKEAHLLAQVLALRLYGHGPADTAAIMGVPTSRVMSLLHRVRREADIESQLQRIDAIAVPLAVDNIVRGVILGDKDYTLELARGRGLFKTHASVKQETTITDVTISIDAKVPAHLSGQPLPQPKPGAIVGAAASAPAPRIIEGELVETDG